MAQITFDRKEVEKAMLTWIQRKYQSGVGEGGGERQFSLKTMSQKWITMETLDHDQDPGMDDDGGEQ